MQSILRSGLALASLAISLSCCNSPKKDDTIAMTPQAAATDTAPAPAETIKAIEAEFPGALRYEQAIDSILKRLHAAGANSEQILWGQSTCVDDITNTKNKLVHPETKGPFTFGGLGGLPFTGVTGINAFAHHVPENGTAVLFVGPHIGYSKNEGWGKILRHGHEQPSSCCGALVAALDKLQKNEIIRQSPDEEDYQEQVIEQLAFKNKQQVLQARVPLIALTKVVSNESERLMTSFAKQVHGRHFAYAVVIVGVIINTDYMYDDYLWIDHVAVKDIKNDKWILQ